MSTLPSTCIPKWIPDILKKPLLNQTPIITRKNVDKPIPSKDICTIHNNDFQDQTALSAYHLFKAAAILTMHKYLTAVEHKKQSHTVVVNAQLHKHTQEKFNQTSVQC